MKTEKQQTAVTGAGNLPRAQRLVMERLASAHAIPYEKRNYGTFRFHGRGMARTLAALEAQGLITYKVNHGLTGDDFQVYLKVAKLQ